MYAHLSSHLAQFFSELDILNEKYVLQKYQNTHFVFSNVFLPENRAVYKIMWENMVQPDRPRMAIWRMSIACWIPKATNTHSEYVIFLFHYNNGDRGGTVVKVLCYKSEGRWFDSRWCHWNFSLT